MHCDIALPGHETSVSRKHIELTVTEDGRCYIVHVHGRNTTLMQGMSGNWEPVSQAYVEMDTPLMLGGYRTSARALLSLLGGNLPEPPIPSPPYPQCPAAPMGGNERVAFDPERGSYVVIRSADGGHR